jgi:hypothetical protein
VKFENRYTRPERLLHDCAFRSGGLQVALADIEDRMYAGQLAAVSADDAVFVTALPRAGTTILLNVLVATGVFASHTYRDMPFVLCPMLWDRLARGFRTTGDARERAHADGLMVSADSPEAFEEMIWRQFWPEHYREAAIVPWHDCADPEFLDFFGRHMRKIVALRTADGAAPSRYLSKNNLNISRLACLPRALPTAKFLVPFREPVQHAASLRKQHASFLATHAEDAFARRYMEGIGHYDFGANFRPVAFDDWLAGDRRAEANGLGFWLEYWIAAYRHIAKHVGGTVRLVSYGRLTEEPQNVLEWLAAFLALPDRARLIASAGTLRPPRDHDVDLGSVAPRVVAEARELHAELERLAEL